MTNDNTTRCTIYLTGFIIGMIVGNLIAMKIHKEDFEIGADNYKRMIKDISYLIKTIEKYELQITTNFESEYTEKFIKDFPDIAGERNEKNKI